MSKYERALKLWQKWNVKTEADIDLRLDNFRILFAFNSGKIENDAITYHDTREIFENGQVQGFTGNPRALFETQNQRLCYELLKPKLAAKEPLSVALVKSVHEVLTGGTYDERRYVTQGERPGEFKKHDYVTGRAEVGSHPEDVERDISELLDEIAAFNGNELLKAAAYFHARFEHIHPFADGNGRVGRTLLNYFLMIRNHPPIIVHEEDKRGYYDALEKYDMDEEITPMWVFLKAQAEKTWEKTLERQRDHDAR
jgi:Fic family protein